MDTQFSSYLSLSSHATFQLFAIWFIGAFWTKLKVFNRKAVEGLIDYNEFLIPMLVFTHILKGFDITDFSNWLPVIVIFMIHIVIGAIIGLCLSYFSAHRHNALRFFISSLCLPQTLTLQLLLIENFAPVIESISQSSGQVFSITARNRALNYVIVWYLFEHLLRTTVCSFFMTSDANQIKEKGDDYHKIRDESEEDERSSTNGIVLTEVFSISFVTFIITIILAFISPVKTALLDQSSIFYSTIFVSSDLIAKTWRVMVIFVFGTALPLIKLDACNLSLTDHILNAATKLVIFPLFGYLIIYLFLQGYSWFKDPVLIFIMLIQFSSPTSFGLFKTATQRTQLGNDFLVSLTVQHIAAIIILTLLNAVWSMQLSA